MSEISFSESLDKFKESFLWAAAQGGNTQDCESLLEIGANVNWENSDGDTPLLAACRRGHRDTIQLLLAHGADCNKKGKDSLAPIHVCAKRGDAEALDLLLEANINIAAKTRDGQTALDIAKSKGFENIYSRLMKSRSLSKPNHIIQKVTSSRKEQLPSLDGSSKKKVSSGSTYDTSKEKDNENVNQITSSKSDKFLISSSKKEELKDESTKVKKKTDYSLIGSGIESESNEMVKALKEILDNEREARKILEEKLGVFKNQNSELLHEYNCLNEQYHELQSYNNELEKKINRLLGVKPSIEELTIEECEDLEKKLKFSLDAVENKKALLIKEKIENQTEQRLCVICQEKEKSVVLLPCRHMCLCDACSDHDQIVFCPLCREAIAHKISVFS